MQYCHFSANFCHLSVSKARHFSLILHMKSLQNTGLLKRLNFLLSFHHPRKLGDHMVNLNTDVLCNLSESNGMTRSSEIARVYSTFLTTPSVNRCFVSADLISPSQLNKSLIVSPKDKEHRRIYRRVNQCVQIPAL